MVARPHETAHGVAHLRPEGHGHTLLIHNSLLVRDHRDIERNISFVGELDEADLERFVDARVVPRALRIDDDVASILALLSDPII